MDIAQSRPRFRTDLVAAPFHDDNQRFVDVTDPQSGKSFRFYEVEFSIACAMDGQRDIAGLLEWARDELGLAATRDELQAVVSTLDNLGYLESAAARPAAAAQPAAAASGGDEFDLGLPGASASNDEPAPLADAGDFELGLAGKSMFDDDAEAGFDAPELTLGVSGNESLGGSDGQPTVSELMPAIGSDDEDEGPTTVKRLDPLEELATLSPPPDPDAIEQTSVQPSLRPVGRPSTSDDGPTNLPPPVVADFDEEVSIDLTDHMRIGADDVKEAVRQSKVIAVPEAAQRLAEPRPPSNDDAQATIEREQPPRLDPPPVRAASAPPPPPSATELPETPVSVTKPAAAEELESEPEPVAPVAPPVAQQPKSRAGVLFVLMLLLIAAAGAYYYYNEIWLPEQQAAATPPAPVPDPVPEPEPEPEPATATIEAKPVEPVEVSAELSGAVAELVESGTEVEADQVVIKLGGFERHERRIESEMEDIERYNRRIASAEEKKQAAEERGNGGERYQRDIDRDLKKIEAREAKIAEEREEMERFLIRAPSAGTFVTELKERDRVSSDDQIFRIELPAVLQASFTIDERASVPPQDTDVTVVLTEDDSKSAVCAVTEVNAEARAVTVICPSDSELSEGKDVTLSYASE